MMESGKPNFINTGNLWSGLTTLNHLSSMMGVPAESDYSDSFVRTVLLKFYKEEAHKHFDPISNYYLIANHLSLNKTSEFKRVKLKKLLESSKVKDYIMLMGLLKSILSKDGK